MTTAPAFVDEPHVLIDAPADAVWRSLAAQFTSRPSAATGLFAHLVGTEPRRAFGRPPGLGATAPGFEVTEAVEGKRLRLSGRHRFSRYRLTFTLTERDGGTDLAARTDADFPGLRGLVYRTLVITSGAHKIVVARMLTSIRRRAEARRP
ncbi:SRPBCC family protein [Phytomonospora sp. NPDC050363]|uniref:SRPBCC family protein n=1 Tax=Phytomonospora sp. NPDC050363 TaxID=3155642 RepID=UPI00340A2292